jgi:hypothetical protein
MEGEGGEGTAGDRAKQVLEELPEIELDWAGAQVRL